MRPAAEPARRARASRGGRIKGALRSDDPRSVIESLLVLAALALLGLLGFVAPLVPGRVWIDAGWVAVAAGLLVGVPTGVVYHLRLARALARRGRLPPRWWLRPTALHGELEARDGPRVLPWCAAGAAGFLVVVAGLLSIVAGVVSEAFRAELLGG